MMDRKGLLDLLRDPFYIQTIIIFVGCIAIYIYINMNPVLALALSAIIYPAIAFIPVATYIPNMREIGVSWEDKFSVMIFSQWLGAIIWFIAEVIWCWYYNLYCGIENPYPSVADVFYVAAYIPVIVGLTIYVAVLYRIVRPELSTRDKIISMVAIVCSGIIVGVLYWSMIVLSYMGEPIPPVEFALNVTYVVLDAILLVVVVFGFLVIRGMMGRVLTLFLISSLLVIVFNVGFAYLEAYDLYYDGHPIELLDILSYLVDALAFYEVAKITKSGEGT